MIERPSARLILLDSEDRLFLFNVHDPDVYDPTDNHGQPMWIMAGGMVDGGETFEQAAIREAREETGLIIDSVQWVWTRSRRMQWRSRQVLHIERFVLGRTVSTVIDTSGLDEKEKSWTKGHRWWRLDEIDASQQRFEPRDLAVCLATLLRDGPPAQPITIS